MSVSQQVPNVDRAACNCGWEELEPSIGLFEDLWGCRWECLLLVPWISSITYGLYLGGAGTECRILFRISGSADWTVFCWIPGWLV